jgi:hypothetical protein
MSRIHTTLLALFCFFGIVALAQSSEEANDGYFTDEQNTLSIKSPCQHKHNHHPKDAFVSLGLTNVAVTFPTKTAVPFNVEFVTPLGFQVQLPTGKIIFEKTGLYEISYAASSILGGTFGLVLDNRLLANTTFSVPTNATLTSATIILPIQANQVLSLFNVGATAGTVGANLEAYLTIKKISNLNDQESE